MKGALCALLLPMVLFLDKVSTHLDLAIPIELHNPDVDRAGSTIEFKQLACREDRERIRPFAITEALPLFPVNPGELSTNQKRVPGILTEEDHVTKRRRLTETHKQDDGHPQDLLVDNKLPPRSYTSSTFPAWATSQFDKTSQALQDHQMSGMLSRTSLLPAAPDMNSIAENLLSEMRRTKLISSGSTNHIAQGFSHSDSSPMHPYKKFASAAATSTGTENQQKKVCPSFLQCLVKSCKVCLV
jgi:hypothetical protein